MMRYRNSILCLIGIILIVLVACQPRSEIVSEPGSTAMETQVPSLRPDKEPTKVNEEPVKEEVATTEVTPSDNGDDESNYDEWPTVCKPLNDFLPLPIASELLQIANQEPLPSSDLPCTFVKAGDENKIGEMVLALVAPFPTVVDEIPSENLKAFWQKGESEHFDRLLMFPYAKHALTWLWGEPKGTIEIFDYSFDLERYNDQKLAMLKEAWTTEKTWAIVAFEELEPRWKVIALDGQSPIHKACEPSSYALTIPLSLYDDDPNRLEDAKTYFSFHEDKLPLTNYKPEELATVILTGVTALARGTAAGMDERGILVPGEDLAEVLREADILHISNEIPFAENCPKQTVGTYLTLCSPESYMELLRHIGTDVVELTGDHFQDYGSEAMLFTLGLYDQEGWAYYGGGRDIYEARAPIKLEVNGNKIAFLGCNAKSPNFARASETSTGAYHCDMNYMAEATQQLKAEGYLPIVTFQHEEFYDWSPLAWLVRDFGLVLDAGAVIASGSQAHQPHYAEFVNGGFAHYGLGNLFFDQYGIDTYTHWGFIDRHVFYQGRHISTELLTIRFLDRVKATWATPEERVEMLEMIFNTARMDWKGLEASE